MKKTLSLIKNHLIQKYTLEDESLSVKKSTNINVLLNRVKLDQKKESRKKLLFTVLTSAGLLLFGALVF
tara:strand:+ start:426 stop:632 length:207 start_codon:yes stop_codon:yes gene_type:complete